MSIGMKRGTVYLENHSTEWETAASYTIQVIKNILQDDAIDIQHIGSTSIKTIPAKPIIDIAVDVEDHKSVILKKDKLEAENIIFRFEEKEGQHNGDKNACNIEDNLDIAEWLADCVGYCLDECFGGVEYLIGDNGESYAETADCYADEYHAQLCEIGIYRYSFDYYHSEVSK